MDLPDITKNSMGIIKNEPFQELNRFVCDLFVGITWILHDYADSFSIRASGIFHGKRVSELAIFGKESVDPKTFEMIVYQMTRILTN